MKKPVRFHTRRQLGCQRLEPRVMLDASALRLTEFLASNDGSLLDFEGDAPDWVEIYNPSDSTVSLDDLYLTDDADEPTKWSFPANTQIGPGGYTLVFASDKDTVMPNGEVHANFRLSAGGEYLGLIAADGLTVIDAFAPEYPNQEEDISYGLTQETSGVVTTLVAPGAAAKAWRPTSSVFDTTWTDRDFNDSGFNIQGPTGLGYELSPGNEINYSDLIETPVPAGLSSLYVRIPFNLTTLAGMDALQLRMKYDDGFVAYLNGVEIASANADDNVQWNSLASANHDDFLAVEYETFDASGAVPSLVVGENVLAIHGLNLANSSDFLLVPELTGVASQIVMPERFGFFEEPTPGYANGESFGGFAAEPEYSVPHGFYETPRQVAITSETPGALIVYTTDGSLPEVDANLVPVNGTVYTGPIAVASTTTLRARAFKQDFRPSFVSASSYLFLDDVLDQSPQGQTPPGWANPGTNGKDLNYGIDPEIRNLYGDQAIAEALESIPSIALTTDLDNLFDPATGIYVNSQNRGRTWERETSVELIHPDGSEGFSTNAGLRIRGGFSRNDFNPKNGFRLYFRGEYGDGKLDYPLFGDEGTDEFDVLDLRTPQNYSWSSSGNVQNTFLREVFARDTQAALGQPYTRSEYYHLYLDGQYWGIYMTQERIEEFYGESYFDGNESDYDVVKSDLAVSGGTEIADGNDLAWRELFDLAQALADNPTGAANNYWTMQGLNPDGTRNESLPVLLDAENLVDYMLIIFYTGGYDTGLSRFLGNERANNWFGIRNRETGDQGFQFFLHDNEHSLGAEDGNVHGTAIIDRTGPFLSNNDRQFFHANPQFLHQDLLVHPEYRQLFVDRVQRAMFNNGPLTSEQNIARLLERKAQVEPAIIAESARWGDSKVGRPRTKATWDTEVEWLTNNYFPQRGSFVLSQLQNDGLHSGTAAPELNQFGGMVPLGFALTMTGGTGTIYYTTDGETDPRAIGGAVNASPEVEPYTGPITLNQDTVIRARLRSNTGEWSGLVEAAFDVSSIPGDYDANGLVNGDDNQLWRATYGSTIDLRSDGNNNGRIDAADYTIWRDALDAAPLALAQATAPASSLAALLQEVATEPTPNNALLAAFASYELGGRSGHRYSQPRGTTITPGTPIPSTAVRQEALALLIDPSAVPEERVSLMAEVDQPSTDDPAPQEETPTPLTSWL